MRALGLPNTKHFHEITRIEDAIACASNHPPSSLGSENTLTDIFFFLSFAVAEKLKQEGKQEMFQAELTEELEDADGNVYNRKVSAPFSRFANPILTD